MTIILKVRQDVVQNGVRVVGFCPCVVNTTMADNKDYMQIAKDKIGILK
jgi:NADP-dependent 3-hydroxy acid dehydrogenase YdfG